MRRARNGEIASYHVNGNNNHNHASILSSWQSLGRGPALLVCVHEVPACGKGREAERHESTFSLLSTKSSASTGNNCRSWRGHSSHRYSAVHFDWPRLHWRSSLAQQRPSFTPAQSIYDWDSSSSPPLYNAHVSLSAASERQCCIALTCVDLTCLGKGLRQGACYCSDRPTSPCHPRRR